jgi:hypothetical protein
VNRSDREARLERAKAIGRIAYRYARDATIVGFIETEGERKLVRDFKHGSMSIEFYEAAGRCSMRYRFLSAPRSLCRPQGLCDPLECGRWL